MSNYSVNIFLGANVAQIFKCAYIVCYIKTKRAAKTMKNTRRWKIRWRKRGCTPRLGALWNAWMMHTFFALFPFALNKYLLNHFHHLWSIWWNSIVIINSWENLLFIALLVSLFQCKQNGFSSSFELLWLDIVPLILFCFSFFFSVSLQF